MAILLLSHPAAVGPASADSHDARPLMPLQEFVDSLTGQTVPNLELIDGRPPYRSVMLHDWIDRESKPAVLAFLDRNLVEHHAQFAPLERLADSTYRKVLGFGIVLMHKNPAEYIRFLSPARPSPCRLFAIRRSTMVTRINPGSYPVILLISRHKRIFKCYASYCDYDILKRDIVYLLDDYRQAEGDHP